MDWLQYFTLYAQGFLAIPLEFLVFWAISAGLIAPIMNRIALVVKSVQESRKK